MHQSKVSWFSRGVVWSSTQNLLLEPKLVKELLSICWKHVSHHTLLMLSREFRLNHFDRDSLSVDLSLELYFSEEYRGSIHHRLISRFLLCASDACCVMEQKDEGGVHVDSPCGIQTQPGQAGLCE